MGKSDKKLKSDRINALKKQYDAFLEDDKKRKERNEYILEKLDKMRYCTAMVQVRQKPPAFTDQKVSLYNMPEQTLDSHADIHLDVPRSRVDEAVLLQEISKKYILIPKLRPPSYDNDYTKQIKPKIEANTDWKSKYDILDQLKRDEKEQDNFSPHEILLNPDQDDMENIYDRKNNVTKDDEPLEYKHELPEKLQPEDHLPYELQQYSKDDEEIDPTNHYGNQLNDTTENIHASNTGNTVYDKENVRSNLYDDNTMQDTVYDQNTIQNIDFEQNNIETTVYDDQQNIDTVYDQIPSKDNTEYLSIHEDNVSNDKCAPNKDEEIVESVQLLGINKNSDVEFSAEMYPPINNENNQEYPLMPESVNNHDQYVPKEEHNNNIVDTDNKAILPKEEPDLQHIHGASGALHGINNNIPTEYDANMPAAIDTASVQDFTPDSNVELLEGVHVNPTAETLVEENDVTSAYHPVEIDNAIPNAETGDGFYNEQTEGYDYTTEGVENYNAEYSAPTENYQQNEEYAYYEGAQPEQPYSETNEHEQTPQQYDQSYEQQYGNAYDQEAYQQEGYEQEYAQGYDQQGYTEPQQQYEDQAQQDVQYQDNITPQYVEQQLDHAEGYAETANEKNEDNNVENVMESQQIPAVVESKATVQ